MATDDQARINRYIQYASALIGNYKGGEPFQLYLKKYFRENTRHGSKDRKKIASLCYQYFRLGNGITVQMTLEEQILFAEHLLANGPVASSGKLNEHLSTFDPDKIFPFPHLVSTHIDLPAFNRSFLIQPLLFIRIRPGFHHRVNKTLRENDIPFKVISKDCIALENSTNTSDLASLNKEIVIQDINSQNISLFLERIHPKHDSPVNLWDACAGSGGKSILAKDFIPNIHLTVSDIRNSILKNLIIRFRQSGIKDYHLFTVDLTKPLHKIKGEPFDVIVADVPCSGSGTWARTPESIQFFKPDDLAHYIDTQQSIVANCISKLKSGGYFLYITCSVFEAENENNVAFICKNFPLRVVHHQYLKGYNTRADTLFVCLLKKEEVSHSENLP